MRLFGIIGRPVAHSASPAYYNARFAEDGIDARYDFLELPSIEAIEPLLPNLCGFNVTSPYKLDIMRYLDDITEEAQAIGAVNCVVRQAGKLVGYNTDYDGFKDSLTEIINSHQSVNQPEAIIFGTGGASLVVAYVLDELGIKYIVVSRTKELTYSDLTAEMINAHKLLINATPLGMSPNAESAVAIPYKAISHEHILYDLIYNPSTTRFLKEGQQRGATICNGYRMWLLQAERSYGLYTGL